VTLVTFGQIAADRTARCTAQSCTDGGASPAAQAVADYRTTGCPDTTADGCFGAAALASRQCTARRACNAGTHCGTGATAHFLTEHITQRATQAAAQRSGAVTGSHCTLSNQKAQNQSRQS
jgi:hypothetical protein